MEKAKRGKYKEAIEDFTQAVCINPNYATAYKYRGLAYSRLGDAPAASADFQNAADLYLKHGHTRDYQDVSDRAFNFKHPLLNHKLRFLVQKKNFLLKRSIKRSMHC
jgi:tetratricopeptide (TPR) repeat protein